ncbi:MAG: 50S ribosomal protein L23 [Candidatus Delongbacteria bacterium]|nr:50S ribosomal protein L23 [Candidatus Delongbacteria bacterium]MDD4204551.1 50S ribosomal protein L23 [Candidatus Delongbacteria bacterium]MDY0017489.1 50S ribosomal protein L23 [Candidatus Delongbacteria bacterium]
MKMILRKPHITEKTSKLQEKNNQYTFLVDVNANKIEIKREIESRFRVSVTGVNTVNYDGRKARVGRYFGKKSDFKKATVTLAKGDKLDIYEQA